MVFFILRLCLFQLNVKPGQAECKCIVQAFLVTLLDNLVGVLGINNLNENLRGNAVIALSRITHNIEAKHASVVI